MDPALTSLIAASIAFVGTHFALSHPLRTPLVRMVGELGFSIVYSIVAFATLGWMVLAFRDVEGGMLGGSGDVGWVIATLLTLPAMVLLFGSYVGNPAMPMPGAAEAARKEPQGAFRVTRHPMMWGIALWAVSHMVMWWSWRTNVVALAILVLALVGAHLQDRKKQVQMGDAWREWESKTSFWPRWGALPNVGATLWIAGTVGWLAATYAHILLGDLPAGIWRYI
ncbi:NnrU family protein [Aurantiacibacter sp. D1-12]|uniref:NnrU family protein n=1 Tax=Aurantiacibacter sp. D1-12 TaxID=2993658 RepID=UPI00237D293C|nr:NnrU family protein [Aurantiacibacter sp. D1-12]MDE1468227.1 NnrU family protein [Aurantiacibacter sp. D1-12]